MKSSAPTRYNFKVRKKKEEGTKENEEQQEKGKT